MVKRLLESYFLPLLLFIIGLFLSSVIAWKSEQWIEETEKIRFDNASTQIRSLIQKELSSSIQLVRATSAFINTSETMTRKLWKQFTDENHVNKEFLGLRGIGYAPLVKPLERNEHESDIRKEGFSEYAILQKNSTSTDLFPITYLEPMSEINQKAFGFDLASEPTRRAAIYEAFKRADATLSSKIELVQKYDTDNKAGFHIFFPVYQSITIPNEPAKRIEMAKGVVYMAIDAKKLFQEILHLNYIRVDFEIYDGAGLGLENKLFDSNPSLQDARLSHYTILDMYGKTWTLHLKANEVLDVGYSHYFPWIQLMFGALFFGLLSGWVYALQRTRKEAYRIADEKTKQLSQSEAAIRSIFEAMQEGVMVLDDEGAIVECNLAAQEMLQLRKRDITSNFDRDPQWSAIREDGTLFDKEERPSLMALNTGLAQNNIIMGIRRENSSLLWVTTNAQPIFTENRGKISSVLVTVSDITAYRSSKRELEKYLQIIDTHVNISSTDLEGIITEVSEKFCKISGYTKEELIGRSHNLVRHPDMPSTFYKEMWVSLKKGIPWYGEIKNRSKNGVDYWIETIIAPRYNEEYHLIGYMAIHHDITDKKRVEELSITDRLTKLYNRLKLDELFAYHLSIAKRHQTPLSIILLDIDKFKLVNDTYGHQVGDSLLQGIAKLLKANVRLEDAVGRWGGEEFLILLPGSDIEAACILAEKLRALIETRDFAYAGSRTASFGVATCHVSDDETSMVARADEALYRAKEKGRNRVEIEIYSCTEPTF